MLNSTTYIGNKEPSSYSSIASGSYWHDSNVREFDIKKRIGTAWSDLYTTNQNIKSDGTFTNIKPLPFVNLTKKYTPVTVTEETKAIECTRAGATYNQYTNRCEGYTSDACDGNYFDTVTGYCYQKPLDYCVAIGYLNYDANSNVCYRNSTAYVNKTTVITTVGGILDLGNKVPTGYFPPSVSYMGSRIAGTSTNILNQTDVQRIIAVSNRNYIAGDNASWTPQQIQLANSSEFLASGRKYKVTYASHLANNGNYRSSWSLVFSDVLTNQSFSYTLYSGHTQISNNITSTSLGTTLTFVPYRVSDFPINETINLFTKVIYNNVCPDSSWTDIGLSCKKTIIEYAGVPSSWASGYNFYNGVIGGADAYIKAPTCIGRYMTASGYTGIATPHYGNNGICYSDTALYCRTYAGSTNTILLPNGKQVLCWDNTQTCNDTRFNLVYDYSSVSDKCNKFNYSCTGVTRYGLAENPTL